MKSSLKLVILFKLFKGVVAFELVFELLEGMVVAFELFDRPFTFRNDLNFFRLRTLRRRGRL